MTLIKREKVLAIVIAAIVIIAVQRWLLPSGIERTFTLRKEEANSTIANAERSSLESEIAKSVMFRKNEANSSITKRATKVILFYTKWFGISKWLTCRLTQNGDEFQRSDALIFHGWDLPSVTVLKEVEKSKPSKQRWIFYLMESPVINAGHKPALFNGMFNWTLTYRLDSDFLAPYGYYAPLTPDEINLKPQNYADKLVAWGVSHCGMLRDEFVTKLLKYMKVDIFGSCANKFNQHESCPRGSQECHKKLQLIMNISCGGENSNVLHRCPVGLVWFVRH